MDLHNLGCQGFILLIYYHFCCGVSTQNMLFFSFIFLSLPHMHLSEQINLYRVLLAVHAQATHIRYFYWKKHCGFVNQSAATKLLPYNQ